LGSSDSFALILYRRIDSPCDCNFYFISYKKLQLAVLNQAVDLENLSIFQERKAYFSKRAVHLHAGIIGTSHFVQLQYADGSFFTEMFACNKLDEREVLPLCILPMEQLNNPVKIHDSQISYHFTHKKLSYTASRNDITNWSKQAQKEADIFLQHHFEPTTPNTPSSRTLLSIQSTQSGILIETVHEYQEENTIILTESMING